MLRKREDKFLFRFCGGRFHPAAIVETESFFYFGNSNVSRRKNRFVEAGANLGIPDYLYFIATDDPDINISRVHNRVAQGGHSVPEDRITSRYHRSLNLLMDAILFSNRAYIFDNSTDAQEHTWLAEITDGSLLELKSDRIPAWFKKSVLDKI